MDPRQIPVSELENKNLDRDVTPEVMTRGIAAKTSGGSWVYVAADTGGNLLVNSNASFVDVDTVFTSVTSGGTIYTMQEYYGGHTMTTNFGYDAYNNVSAVSTSIT